MFVPAATIGKLILNIMNYYNIQSSNIELIGHSLGAHVCGYVGKWIISYKGEKLKKIVALDSAGPLWIGEKGLSPTDARIVESIHTNGALGLNRPHGTVDFYCNEGDLFQPGCLTESYFMVNKAGKIQFTNYYYAHIHNCRSHIA